MPQSWDGVEQAPLPAPPSKGEPLPCVTHPGLHIRLSAWARRPSHALDHLCLRKRQTSAGTRGMPTRRMPEPAMRSGLQCAGQAALSGLRSWASGVESALARGAAALTPGLPDIDAREAASVLLALSGTHRSPSPTHPLPMPC